MATKQRNKRPITKLSAVAIGELENSYEMPCLPGKPGDVLMVNKKGNAVWREHRTGNAEKRKLFGSIDVQDLTDTVIVYHSGFESSDYVVLCTLRNTSDAHNVPSWLITGQDKKAFEVTFSGPVKGRGYVLNWMAIQ